MENKNCKINKFFISIAISKVMEVTVMDGSLIKNV